MTYKIKLADSDTYEIKELPIETVVNRKGEDLKAIKFYVPAAIAEGQLSAVKTFFSDATKTSVMEFLENDQNVGRSYADYTLLYLISMNEDGDYIITMVKETTIPTKLVSLEEEINSLKESLSTNAESLKIVSETLTATEKKINDVSDTVTTTTESVESISAQLAGPDVDAFSLDELKAYRVQQSKENLANYLATHTVTSTAHKGIAKEYSITSEKQSYLMSMVMMAQAAETAKVKQLNVAFEEYENKDNITYEEFVALVEGGTVTLDLVTFTPSWNASGEVCTYDWTLDELITLAGDIENMVRPLVSTQQTMEAAIMNATSKDEVNAVTITF